MADEPSTVTPETDQATPGEAVEPAEQQDSTDWKAEARKWEQRAKENREAAKALESQRKAAMTEAERAVAEAEERGRTAALTSFGQRLARTEFIAEAAKRNPGFDATSILDDLNLARYIGEDGEPDSKAIAKAAQRLIPEANAGGPQPPSFDGGTRQAAPGGVSMNDLLRRAAGRA
jgi:hypothetical protein